MEHTEAAANARLIAAAPDLLLACKALSEFQATYFKITGNQFPGGENCAKIGAQVVAMANLAIKKAEGK